MKILWLYQFMPNYCFDDWLHLHYANWINESGLAEVKTYGPKIHESAFPKLMIKEYVESNTLERLHKIYKFDVIICNTKSRMFAHYNPLITPRKEIGCWLPGDFKNWNKTPKIMIEEDYQYEIDDYWYFNMGFNLILQRHRSNWKRGIENINNKCKHEWLPFSVDTNVFYPYTNVSRKNKLCLVGSANPYFYVGRDLVGKTVPKDRLDSFTGFSVEERITGENYPLNLNSYISHVCCSLKYNITPAKIFEIMACGSLLFTDVGEYGLEELFEERCYIQYKHEIKDILEKTNYILSGDNKIKMMADKGSQIVLEKHNHKVRTLKLLEKIKEIS